MTHSAFSKLHIKLGLMKQFLKVMKQDGNSFMYNGSKLTDQMYDKM
jgi:hypothetical protein